MRHVLPPLDHLFAHPVVPPTTTLRARLSRRATDAIGQLLGSFGGGGAKAHVRATDLLAEPRPTEEREFTYLIQGVGPRARGS